MKQEVRIVLRSTRYEVEASLFSKEEDEALPYELGGQTPEPEQVELRSLGTRVTENGRTQISYAETEATGMEGSTTAISYQTDEPGVVSMLRQGTVSTALVFEEGKRHHCLYQTPYMPFEICVRTLKVDNRLTEEGKLELDYIIEIRGAKAERTKFSMEVL